MTQDWEQDLREELEMVRALGRRGPVCAIRIESIFDRLQKQHAEMLEAMTEADSSLTWCRARHRNVGHNAEVLDEAIRAVLKFTRARAAINNAGGGE